MKTFYCLALLACLSFSPGCGTESGTTSVGTTTNDAASAEPAPESNSLTFTDQIVEASCGQCQFDMEGGGHCDLAIRIDGKSYFVDGSSIDDHGDAHGDDGLCNCIRKARVTGGIRDGRFVATSVEVLPKDD